VIPQYSDSQAYGEEEKREDEMAKYALCESSPTEERLLSMFVHEALNKRFFRRMRTAAGQME
jgi:hypothetical protein